MRVAILGAGAVGTTFAAALARAGHEVTVIARGARLAVLEGRSRIEDVGGGFVAVTVATRIDPDVAWDFLLVCVLGHQVPEVLAELRASAARRIVFMFNTFEALNGLRDAVGQERFGFAFPAVLATFDEAGRIDGRIQERGLLTTVTDEAIASFFETAKIRTTIEPDMESWLRAHVAAVVPFMLAVVAAHRRKAGIAWADAAGYAAAMKAAFALVERLGNRIIPAPIARMQGLPARVITGILWVATRVPRLRALGAAGAREPRALLEAMLAAAPEPVPALVRVVP